MFYTHNSTWEVDGGNQDGMEIGLQCLETTTINSVLGHVPWNLGGCEEQWRVASIVVPRIQYISVKLQHDYYSTKTIKKRLTWFCSGRSLVKQWFFGKAYITLPKLIVVGSWNPVKRRLDLHNKLSLGLPGYN